MRTKRPATRFGRRRRSDVSSAIRQAVLYARVYTPDQEKEGYSIPAQVKLLEDYAVQAGVEIVSRHVDVETARKAGRTAFGEMLQFLRKRPQIRILLVEKTDRRYRNVKDWAVIDELKIEVRMRGSCRDAPDDENAVVSGALAA